MCDGRVAEAGGFMPARSWQTDEAPRVQAELCGRREMHGRKQIDRLMRQDAERRAGIKSDGDGRGKASPETR